MDFKLVVLVLFAYFIRPQDWVPGLSGINIMKPLMVVTLLTMFGRRRGISSGSFVRTPLDWAVIAYAIYIVLAAPDGQRPISAVGILVAYYFVTSQALSTPGRLAIYLRCWLIALVVVAAMALASEYGLDLTGAKDITHAVPDNPRLVLNTYLFGNANSLGHSVVLAIPLAYYLLFWRRPLRQKLSAILFILIASYCVYLTKSKGAFIVGFSVLVASQLFGRPILFQAITLLLAVTIGWQALTLLPRMTDISRARQDEAIMGRMLAWEQARLASKESATGEGFKNFKAIIEYDKEEIFKATHSSYVLVGAELGPYGMFFYLAVLYASLRALLTARCHRQEDETSRRAMFVLLLGYMASGWLIDRSYHLEYFLLAGAISGFHRRMGVEHGLVEPTGEVAADEYEDRDGDDGSAVPGLGSQPVDPEPASSRSVPACHASKDDVVPAAASDDTIRSPEDVDTSVIAMEAIEEELARFWYWRRFGVIDLLLVVLFAKIVFELWDYVLRVYFL